MAGIKTAAGSDISGPTLSRCPKCQAAYLLFGLPQDGDIAYLQFVFTKVVHTTPQILALALGFIHERRQHQRVSGLLWNLPVHEETEDLQAEQSDGEEAGCISSVRGSGMYSMDNGH